MLHMDELWKHHVERKRPGHILCDFIYRKCPEQATIQRQKVAQWSPGAGRRWGVTARRYGISFLEWWKCSKIDVVMFAPLCDYNKNCGIVHFKVNCRVCELHLFFRFYLFIFREKGEEGEKKGRDKSVGCLLLTSNCLPPIENLARNLGLYPDWELNQWPFGWRHEAQPTEPHQSGLNYILIKQLLNKTEGTKTFLCTRDCGTWER